MIPKGNQRGGGQQLATHLMNAFDNDRVEVAEVRGAVAQDLHGAFAEWYAQSKATKCKQYIYSLSINPDHRQKSFTREDYYDFIKRAEKKLRLTGQPRAVVFHVKHGREHCHIIWSRIDAAKGKAVQLSHDHQKLRLIARQYARDHNLTLPPGMENDRGTSRFAFRAVAENLGEKQQQERSGITKKQRREQISKLWTENSDARSFVKALEANGYFLARGDQRDYVVIDLSGEIHSLSKQLSGTATAKQMRDRLAVNYDPKRLLDAAAAQEYAREKRQALLLQKERQQSDAGKTTLAERAAQAKAEAQRRRDDLAKAHAVRRGDLDTKKQKLAQAHEAERKALAEMHAATTAETARDRADRQPKGVLAFLSRITGYNAITAWHERREDRKTAQEQQAQKDALARRHEREMESFKHRESGLTALEKRESRSLETSIRRDVFRRIAAPAKQKEIPPPAIATPQAKTAEAAPQHAKQEPAPVKTVPSLAHVKPIFAEAAAGEKAKTGTQSGLAEKFNRKAGPAPQKPAAQPEFPPAPPPTGDKLREPAEVTEAQKRAIALKDAVNRRAAGHGKEEPAPAKTPPSLAHVKPVFAEAAAPEKQQDKTKGGLADKFNQKAGPAPQKPAAQPEKSPAPPPTGDKPREPAELTEAQKRAIALRDAFNRRAAGYGKEEKDRDREHYRRPPPDFSLRR